MRAGAVTEAVEAVRPARAIKAKVSKAAAPGQAAPVDKSRFLHLTVPRGTTEDRMFADLVSEGLASNAGTAIRFSRQDFPDVSLTDLVASLRQQGEAVNRNDLAAAERMLSAQAASLNAIFGELARRASLNMGEHLDAMEAYMRLALKAQNQCRMTIESLAAIKNPPVVFARQANINNGGQQQVNNGNQAEPSRLPAANFQPEQTGLLGTSDGQRLDAGTASTAGGADPHMEAVGAVHRPAHG